VVKVRLPYQAPVKRHPPLIERAIPTWDRGVVSEVTVTSTTNSAGLLEAAASAELLSEADSLDADS
jgi:hypothetical protein